MWTEILGRALREQLLDKVPLKVPLKLLPPERRSVPPAEPLAAVPRKKWREERLQGLEKKRRV